MSSAFEELFGIADAFAHIPMSGRTDAWLLGRALQQQSIPHDDPRVARYQDVYVRHLVREIDRPPPSGNRKGVLPGIRALLDALTCRPACVGLLTGNYEPAARVKLEHFRLWHYFGGGAFGDSPDRNALLSRAIARVARCGGPTVAPGECVIIGDTPLDVAVAKAGGARSVAVATGSHRVAELRAAGADLVFEDLADTASVLAAIG